MHLYVCIDSNGGLRFNARRQSRDSAVCADILRCARGEKLHMTAASQKLFDSSADNILISEAPASAAAAGEHCFAEALPLSPFADKFESVSIYCWNRSYPADEKLDFSPTQLGLRLVGTYDFAGTSHEKITKEVYTR